MRITVSPAPATEAGAREPDGWPVTVRMTAPVGPGDSDRRSRSATRVAPHATASDAAAATITADRAPRARPSATAARSGRWSAAATRPASAARTTAAGRSEGDMAAQRGEPRGADAAHLIQLGDRSEAAVLGAVVDDALAQRRPDPVQRLKLLERGRVERDRCGGRCGARSRRTHR